MKVIFHPDAEAELAEATQRYDNARDGLGREFETAVELRINEVVRDPSSWPQVKRTVRRVRILRFPYDLLFKEEQDTLFIIALFHHHRQPGYWWDRIHDIQSPGDAN